MLNLQKQSGVTEDIDFSGLDSDFDVTEKGTLPDGTTKQAIVFLKCLDLAKLNFGYYRSMGTINYGKKKKK